MRSSTDSRTSQSHPGKTKGEKSAGRSNPQKKAANKRNKDMVDIQPVVHFFRVPKNPSPGSVMHGLLPPYWLYHDHAFGVIWTLFHPDKKFIGIGQLHWCLRFLLDLKNTDGEYTEDVNICIQAVQDDLIERYANLGTTLANQEIPKSEVNDKMEKNNIESSDARKNDEVVLQSEREEGAESAKESSDKENRKLSVQSSTCSSIHDSGNFSLTYNQMISRGPAPYTEQTPLEQIYKAGAGTTTADMVTSTPEIAALLTSDTSPPGVPLSEMGTEELSNFLDSSRKEQIQRIKKEIERLYDLEKFMVGLVKPGFHGYVTDDLARRLDQLDDQGIVREVDDMFK